MPRYSSSMMARCLSTRAFRASTWSAGRATTTSALKGMAFRMLPPCHEARRAPVSAMALRTRRTITLLALARPSLISSPLCPPRSPFSVTRTAFSWLLATGLYSSDEVTSMPPADPMTNLPQSSESRFMRMSECNSPSGSSLAPYMPVSSSRVMSASTGPCFRSALSITPMMAATPMPSSEPSVVPRACTHPSSM